MKRYLLRASATFLLIALALYGALFSLIGTFSLWVREGQLLAVILIAAAAAALIFNLAAVRLRRALALGALAFVLILAWVWHKQLFTGGQFLFYQISFRYNQIVSSIPYYYLPKAVAGLGQKALTAASTRLAGLLVCLLALFFGLCYARLSAFWPPAIVAALFPAVGLIVLLDPPVLPAVALVAVVSLSALSARAARQDFDAGCKRLWLSAVPVAIVLALVLKLIPPSHYTRPLFIDDWREVVMEQGAQMGITLGSGNASTTATTRTTQGRYNLANAGPLSFNGRAQLLVQGLPAGYQMIRGYSSGVYGRAGWEPMTDSAYETLPLSDDYPSVSFPAMAYENALAQAAVVTTPVDSSQLPSVSITATGGDGSTADVDLSQVQTVSVTTEPIEPVERTITITAQGSARGYVYTPYFPADRPVDMEDVRLYRDSYLLPGGESDTHEIRTYPEAAPGPTAVVTGPGQYWELCYREWARANYLDVPLDRLTPEALLVFEGVKGQFPAGTTSYASDPVNAALTVGYYLTTISQYDLDTPRTPDGNDFVSYFLTESHRGYCVHYASAATLMLRYLGVPARFTNGYSLNVPEGADTVVLSDYHAHSWVEVYVDGFGWYPVDVTPGHSGSVAPDEPLASPSPSPSPSPTPPPTETPTPRPDIPLGTPDGPAEQRPRFPWAKVLPPVLIVAAVLGLIWLQARLRRMKFRRTLAHADPNRAAVAAWYYLLAIHRRTGIPIPDRARALAEKAAFSQHTLTAEERSEMDGMVKNAYDLARLGLPLWKYLLMRYVWALI